MKRSIYYPGMGGDWKKNLHKTPKSGVMDGPTDQPMDIAGYIVPCTATKKGTLAPNPDRGVRENEDN